MRALLLLVTTATLLHRPLLETLSLRSRLSRSSVRRFALRSLDVRITLFVSRRTSRRRGRLRRGARRRLAAVVVVVVVMVVALALVTLVRLTQGCHGKARVHVRQRLGLAVRLRVALNRLGRVRRAAVRNTSKDRAVMSTASGLSRVVAPLCRRRASKNVQQRCSLLRVETHALLHLA